MKRYLAMLLTLAMLFCTGCQMKPAAETPASTTAAPETTAAPTTLPTTVPTTVPETVPVIAEADIHSLAALYGFV